MAEPTKTIYSYYSPETQHTVEAALADLSYSRGGMPTIHDLLKRNYEPGLDDLHLPLMEKYEAFARSEGVIGLESFAHKYFTNGSSEGIFHLLTQANMVGDPVYVLNGEYQGYTQYGNAIGMVVDVRPDLEDLMVQPPGTVILSNPASKDGNIVEPNVLTTILRKHHVIIDLAYMGMTRKPLNVDLTQPGILGALGSLSKPFGLYYYRIGFCYTRTPVESLYGNRWFKNALSIKIGERVLDEATPKKMAAFKEKYFTLQARAVKDVNARFAVMPMGQTVGGSDVWLLARASLGIDAKLPKGLEQFKRDDQNYRFCLTPYYMEWQRMAETGNYDDFVPGEHVQHIESGKRGFVHHNFQFPGKPWQFAVDFEDGTQGVYTTDQLRYVEGDDEG